MLNGEVVRALWLSDCTEVPKLRSWCVADKMAGFIKPAAQMPFLMITGNRRRQLSLVNEHMAKSKRLSLSMTAISIMLLQVDKRIPSTLPMTIKQLKSDAVLASTSRVKWVAAMVVTGKVASRVLKLLPTLQLISLSLVVQIDHPSWILQDWTLTQHLILCHMAIRRRATHFFERRDDQKYRASQWRRNKVQ